MGNFGLKEKVQNSIEALERGEKCATACRVKGFLNLMLQTLKWQIEYSEEDGCALKEKDWLQKSSTTRKSY